MAIKWYCDMCGREITDTPVRFRAYTETVSRDLDGYGAADYIHNPEGEWLHRACADRYVAAVREAIKQVRNPE